MQIGRYEVRGVLGRGGWSIVYQAWDPRLGREVALKALADDAHAYPAAPALFRNEARTLARLRHPNIVALYDLDLEAQPPFFVMELVNGTSAARMLAQAAGGLTVDRAVAIIAGLAASLDYLHALGLVHRDIKPGNAFLDRHDRVVLIDFGLVHGPDGAPPAVDSHQVPSDPAPQLTGFVGTPAYMAPELVRGDPIGPAADIYALGVTAYELLAGRPPFAGDLGDILAAQANSAVPSLLAVRPDLPPAVEQVVLSALAKDPWRRPARAGDFAADLAAAARRPPPTPAGAAGWTGDSGAAPPVVPGAYRTNPPLPAPPVAPAPPSVLPPPPSWPPWSGAAAPGAAGAGPPTFGEAPPPFGGGPPPVTPGSVAPNTATPSGWRRWLPRRGGARIRPAPPGGSAPSPPPAPSLRPAPIPPPPAVPPATDPGIRLSSTVFAPPTVDQGETFLVQVFAHLPEQDDEVRALAREFDAAAERRGATGLESLVVEGERLSFELRLPGLVVDEPVQSIVWMSRPQSVQFGVTVPDDAPARTVIGTVIISRERVPIGHVKFKLGVREPGDTLIAAGSAMPDQSMRRYRKAFISYASHDRREVLKRTQMLARVGIDFFQDVLDLEPGQRWERELYREIDGCDLFLLFWSSAAKQSPWVLKEVQYALGRQGGDGTAPPEILPVVIEGPPLVPPPPELAHLHFNDRMLYFMT